MNEIAKVSNLQPASFDDRRQNELTDAQKNLIQLLIDKAESKEVIKRQDLIDFYILNVKKSETYKEYGTKPHPNPIYTHRITDYDNFRVKEWRKAWNIWTHASQWFKLNLGICILKGKLLAIPVIDVQ